MLADVRSGQHSLLYLWAGALHIERNLEGPTLIALCSPDPLTVARVDVSFKTRSSVGLIPLPKQKHKSTKTNNNKTKARCDSLFNPAG